MTKYVLMSTNADKLAIWFDGHGFTRLRSAAVEYADSEIEHRRKLVADQFGVAVEAVECGSRRDFNTSLGSRFAENLNRNVLAGKPTP